MTLTPEQICEHVDELAASKLRKDGFGPDNVPTREQVGEALAWADREFLQMAVETGAIPESMRQELAALLKFLSGIPESSEG